MSALCFLQKKQSKGYGVRDDEAEKEGFLRLISAMRACAPHCALGLIRRSRLLKTLHCSVFSSHTLGRSFKSLPSGKCHEKRPQMRSFFVAEKEGFEPSRQSPQPTHLAGE
ncbi:MAG: hypothetical protein IJO10_03980, partial [Clostridia bacterium]|nr:hypothetical protein [Clostridia bacterium]